MSFKLTERQHKDKENKCDSISESLLKKQTKVSVGSGIFQSRLSCYLIAISANAGCMDLGFIVGGQRTLVKQGNLFGPMSAYIHEHPPSCSLPTPFSNMLQECHSDSDGKAKPRVTSNTSTFCMPSSTSPFTLALPFTKGLKLPHVELGNNDSKKK